MDPLSKEVGFSGDEDPGNESPSGLCPKTGEGGTCGLALPETCGKAAQGASLGGTGEKLPFPPSSKGSILEFPQRT